MISGGTGSPGNMVGKARRVAKNSQGARRPTGTRKTEATGTNGIVKTPPPSSTAAAVCCCMESQNRRV